MDTVVSEELHCGRGRRSKTYLSQIFKKMKHLKWHFAICTNTPSNSDWKKRGSIRYTSVIYINKTILMCPTNLQNVPKWAPRAEGEEEEKKIITNWNRSAQCSLQLLGSDWRPRYVVHATEIINITSFNVKPTQTRKHYFATNITSYLTTLLLHPLLPFPTIKLIKKNIYIIKYHTNRLSFQIQTFTIIMRADYFQSWDS